MSRVHCTLRFHPAWPCPPGLPKAAFQLKCAAAIGLLLPQAGRTHRAADTTGPASSVLAGQAQDHRRRLGALQPQLVSRLASALGGAAEAGARPWTSSMCFPLGVAHACPILLHPAFSSSHLPAAPTPAKVQLRQSVPEPAGHVGGRQGRGLGAQRVLRAAGAHAGRHAHSLLTPTVGRSPLRAAEGSSSRGPDGGWCLVHAAPCTQHPCVSIAGPCLLC